MQKTLLTIAIAGVLGLVQINAVAGPPGGAGARGGGGAGAGAPSAGRDAGGRDVAPRGGYGYEREGHRERAQRGLDESETRSREGLQTGTDHAAPEADKGIDRAWEGLESDRQRGIQLETEQRRGRP